MAARIMYEIEVRHNGLSKYRHIRGSDPYVVQQKAEAQKQAWDEMWEKKLDAEQKSSKREQAAQEKESLKQLAVEKTVEAEAILESLRNTLQHTLSINDAIDWEKLKDSKPFHKAYPTKPQVKCPEPEKIAPEPMKGGQKYQPILGFWGSIIPSIRRNREETATQLFVQDHSAWAAAKENAEKRNAASLKAHEVRLAKTDEDHQMAVQKYEAEKARYLADQNNRNGAIAAKKAEYLAGGQGAVIDYCEMVLTNSLYPDSFPQEFDLEYLPDTRMLLVEYALPSREQIPSLKEEKYIQARNELKDVYLSDKELDAIYDDVIYQITLRSLHELFEADIANALDAIIFNGLVTSINKSSGNAVTTCILSIQARKQEFTAINLANVDPKACFKSLKGVGSSKLHSITAVPPILTISKEDRRFIDGYGVADSLDDSTNLAAMDWEDFEHLIRELFEKEFKQSGGEVKVTQASRDGGVDAVAFDPDPIRGGKIVIQAKRYSNTVGVSAVRDLYGTVMNEGATKGILVTTANYGPDAYEFAKGKPLTLLNGANLLHLLEKHGHRAKIDLKEAKALAANMV